MKARIVFILRFLMINFLYTINPIKIVAQRNVKKITSNNLNADIYINVANIIIETNLGP